jgi:hypothetical protein
MALPPKPDFSKEIIDPETLRLFQAASETSDPKEKKKLLKQADKAQAEYIRRVNTLGIRGALTRKGGRRKKHRTRRRYLGRIL